MEFGKLDNVDGVGFTLPEDNFDPVELWGGKPHPNPELHVASPSWSIKTWVGKIYPPKTKASDFLKCYGQVHSAIEHNGTRYKIPSRQQVADWAAQVPDGFRFCPKFPELITHMKQLKGCESLTDEFIENLSAFGNKLGTAFLLVHPNLGVHMMPKLLSYLDYTAGRLPLTLELRHPSWFQPGSSALEDLRSYLQEKNVSLCLTDVAGRRDACHMMMTNEEAFIRWTGNEFHPSDFSRMDEWAARLARWLKQGLPRLYFFIHQPAKTLCPESCDYMIMRLNELAGTKLKRIPFISQHPEWAKPAGLIN